MLGCRYVKIIREIEVVMEDSMRQRLIAGRKRLQEIDEELLDENTVKDLKHFRDISRERANLDPQVAAFDKYQKNEEDYIQDTIAQKLLQQESSKKTKSERNDIYHCPFIQFHCISSRMY